MLKRIIQAVLFISIQTLFLPLVIIGILDGLYREMIIGKKLGVSFSAGQTLQYRYYMHYFGTRPDPYTVAFTKHLPSESHFGQWAVMGAMIVSHRLFGFGGKLTEVPEKGMETLDSTATMRVIAFDRIISKYVDEVDQIVIPGVGYDMIAQHFTCGKNVRVFEMDQTSTMTIKTETLQKAGIPHDWITYIPVDYSNESWADKLIEAGFDKDKRTLFIWQSVSHFLDEDLVKETLGIMAGLCAKGSIIAQDLYSSRFVKGETSFAVKSQKNMMGRMGEEWLFGLEMSDEPRESVENFLKVCGLSLDDYYQFGEKAGVEPYYFIVESRT